MKIYIERADKTRTVRFKGSVKDLLRKLNINPVVVLVVRNSELLAEDDALCNTDEIKIMSVVSGG